MKKFLLGLLAGVVLLCSIGAMTQSIQDSGLKPKARWWNGGAQDEAWIWAKEVETILEYVGLDGGDVDLATNSGTLTLGKTVNADVAIADGTTYTILAANSGKVHVFPNLTGDCTMTFPTEADGLHYTFIYGGAAEDAQDWIFDTGTNDSCFIGGAMTHDDDDSSTLVVYSDGDSNSILTVLTPNAGTKVEMWCNGTDWYLTATVVSGTDTSVTFADQS
jgi:hypothetical protein